MTVKGAKMCVIVNPKCNPKFDMLIFALLTVSSTLDIQIQLYINLPPLACVRQFLGVAYVAINNKSFKRQ